MASNVFMKIQGIEGESAHDRYSKWCEINKIEFEITNDRYKGEEDADESKKPKKRERITATFGDVTIGKLMDLASTDIMRECWSNSVMGKVEIVCLRADGSASGMVYWRMNMYNVTITNYSSEYSEGELIGEDIVMTSKKFKFTYRSMRRDIKGRSILSTPITLDQIIRTSDV